MQNNKGTFRVKAVGSFFLAVLLLLIFFSKTIYTYGLPIVTATKPKYGKLTMKEYSKGIVEYAEETCVYAKISGRVSEVLAAEGDFVEEGQPLAKLYFDRDEIEKKLKENALSKEKLDIDIENLNMRIDRIRYNMALLEEEEYTADEVSDYDKLKLEDDIKKAEEDYERLKILAEVGGVARQELEQAQSSLETLNVSYDRLLKTMRETEEKNLEAVEDKEKSRAKQLNDYEYDIQSLMQDLKAKDLELKNLNLQEESYLKTLSDYREYEYIYASCEGILVSVSLKEGQTVNIGQEAATIGTNGSFKVECDISLDNSFISVGDECTIYNTSHTIESAAAKITPNDRAKVVTIYFESAEVSAGETFEIYFEKDSLSNYSLVPNGCVFKDSDGYFVYEIKRRDGILGKEFYASRLPVNIGESDASNTAIVGGIMFFEPIVLLSDKSFENGDTIKIKNESDFFEN